MKKISIVGMPMWLGQNNFGTNLGPDAIRAAGLLEKLQSIGADIVDVGNVAVNINAQCSKAEQNYDSIKNLESVQAGVELLATAVSDIVTSGRFPLVIGGDHSIAIGTLAGIAKHYQNLGVIWYDAHADSNTAEISPSGNIHGMSLLASIGKGQAELVNVGGYKNKVKPEHVVMIGLRDMDMIEEKVVTNMPIKIFTAEEVEKKGICNVIDEAIFYLSSKCDGIHLSFDLDVSDPTEICGVGTPVKGGIKFAENLKAMQKFAQYNAITSAEFVEVNPLLDKDGKTVQAAVDLIGALFQDNCKI